MFKNTNKQIAHIFEEIALLYEIQEDRFRSRAYHRGAYTLDNLSENVEHIYKKGSLKALDALPGIGRGMSEKIEEYIKTEKISEHIKLKKKFPINLEELTSVEGLGVKKMKILYKELNIKNLKDLERAARQNKIQKLEGFGKKTEENLLQGIEFIKQTDGRKLLGDVLPYARDLIEEIKKIEGVISVSEAGSLRRRHETIGDIDILIASNNNKLVLSYIENLPQVVAILIKGFTKISVRLNIGLDMDARIVKKESYGAALQYFTGSKAHNIKLRKIAISKKYKLNEYGLFRGKINIAEGMDENLIYKKLGMQYIEPELRTDTGEIELAQKGKLPKLITYKDLKGDLQIQTNWTDGRDSIENMALSAKKAGLEYILITDHTKALAMTNGSDEERLLRQKKEIERLNKKIKGIEILSGAEVNILKDGSLDINDETLAQLDVVGASVHTLMKNMTRDEMTQRIVKAIQNPNVDILFHPTGRKINSRPAYDMDMEEIMKEAKKTGTIIEINASPTRLDLKDEYIRMALNIGIKMCIDSDAHSTEHYKFLEYGIAQARRAGVTKKDIVNTYPLEKFLKSLK